MKTATQIRPPELPHSRGATLTIDGVTRKYGAVSAIDDVSLEVAAGSFVALLGPSGSGKSTLLSVVAGLTKPTKGRVSVDGLDITDVAANERNMGVVFQDYALFPHMSVAENVAFPLLARGLKNAEATERAKEVLELVELTVHANKPPAQLSGGQRQRVALARTLVYSPPIILLDEPLGALDRRLRESLQAELKLLHERVGSTFIMVTHDQDEALGLADTVVVMNEGRIEQAAHPADVYDHPQTPFVATFVGDCNLLTGTVETTATGQHVVAEGRVLAIADSGQQLSGQVALRPEQLSLEPLSADDSDVPFVVDYQRFTGPSTILRGSTPLGEIIAEFGRIPATAPRDLVGQTLSLHWNPARAFALPKKAQA